MADLGTKVGLHWGPSSTKLESRTPLMDLICGLKIGSKLEDCFVNQEDISLSWDQGGHFLVEV